MQSAWVLCALCLRILASDASTSMDEHGSHDSHMEMHNESLRPFNGSGNNRNWPLWGSAGQRQLRSVAPADYADGVSSPSGSTRPSARELLSELFLSTSLETSSTSALYVGWGILVGYDLAFNLDNGSEPFNVPCNDPEVVDVWCPSGSLSDDIGFSRSRAEVDDDDGVRSPINFATAYLDLDWLYGRSKDAADEIRTFDTGHLSLTDDALPPLRADGTWQVTDDRVTRFPVTFALQTILMREHNHCCDNLANGWNATTDEDYYQLCRHWNIAVFQHITENDFSIKILGGSIRTLGAAAVNATGSDDDSHEMHTSHSHSSTSYSDVDSSESTHSSMDDSHGSHSSTSATDTHMHSSDSNHSSMHTHRRLVRCDRYGVDGFCLGTDVGMASHRLRRLSGTYDDSVNAGVDVFFSTVVLPAFFSAMTPTVWMLDEDFLPTGEHGIELAAASLDLHGLIKSAGGIEPILRGAAYSRTQNVDASFVSEISVSSPLFNLAVEAVQRGRDHGVPTYNDAREAYGLERVTSFSEITTDETVYTLLSEAYGNDVGQVDAFVGALAEEQKGTELFFGPLLREAYLEQLYRAVVGDSFHHQHEHDNEDASLTIISDIIARNAVGVRLPMDAFTAPELEVTNSSTMSSASLAEGYLIEWNTTESGSMSIRLSARDVGGVGMIGIGFGGESMARTEDFVICQILSDTAECTDRKGSGRRSLPPLDNPAHEFVMTDFVVEPEWTRVTFTRPYDGDGYDRDYDLQNDMSAGIDTPLIFAWRSGEGLEQHPNTQRGSSRLNFVTAEMYTVCDNSDNFYALHGALMLLAWTIVAPYGLYQARYRKGKNSILGNLWWEMHQECMIVCAEAILPLSITAIVTTGGPHNSSHARWGFYMIAAIVVQLFTGWMRVRGLEAKGSNFSLLHRLNKHLHIYAGWVAYVAGAVQCYRGLELVAGNDQLIFSAVEIDITFSNFKVVERYLFPIWLGIVPPLFLIMEVKKQVRRFFKKGSANLCGLLEVVNEEFSDEAIKKAVEDRLVPRTQELPIYTPKEFNDKVLNGRAWVIVDGAVLDVASFAKRHPGGARLILNAIGTDVTSEIMGEEASMGNANMMFTPHDHTEQESALYLLRDLVVGYLEEEDGSGNESDRSIGSRRTRLVSESSGMDTLCDDSASTVRRYRGHETLRETRGFTGARHAAYSSGEDNVSSAKSVGYTSGGDSSGDHSSGGERRIMNAVEWKAAIMEKRRVAISDNLMLRSRPIPGASDPSASRGACGGEDSGVDPKSVKAVSTMLNPGSAPSAESSKVSTERHSQSTDARTEEMLSSEVFCSSRLGSSSVSRHKRTPCDTKCIGRPKEMSDPLSKTEQGSFAVAEATSAQNLPAAAQKRASISKVLRRLSTFDTAIWADETPSLHDEGRPFQATQRVWEKKSALLFFHVCPLVYHEKMVDGDGRPVYKFVFTCPGGAVALASSISGVCHFNMRVAQETGLGVVERAYNAFAAKATTDEDGTRRVMPFDESSEGEPCIEMRIRICPGGSMSKLLMQLIKNPDNPAVQLQGPFLREHLIPPPAHRNLIMIAAGTGVNPMVQMIRDYLSVDSAIHGGNATGSRSRMVLLWQNNSEGDLYCTDEITQLQVKAGGLLEAVALISGDTTRRNVPGAAFRRAKAKLVAMGKIPGGEEQGKRSDLEEGKSSKHEGGSSRESPNYSDTSNALSAAEILEESKGEPNREWASSPPLLLPQLAPRKLSRVVEEDPSVLTETFSRVYSGEDHEEGKTPPVIDEEYRLEVDDDREVHPIPRPASRVRDVGDLADGSEASCRTSVAGDVCAMRTPPRRGVGLQRSRGERFSESDDSASEARPRGDPGGVRRKGNQAPVTSDDLVSSLQDMPTGGWRPSNRHRRAKKSDGDEDSGTSDDSGRLQGSRLRGKDQRSSHASRQTSTSGTRGKTAASSPSRTKGRSRRERTSSKRKKDEAKEKSSLDGSETGLRRGVISKEVIKDALGPVLLKAIASTRISMAGSWDVDTATKITEVARSALLELSGTSSRAGELKIVVSGPPGFVFHVEDLLKQLHIPPEVIVFLD